DESCGGSLLLSQFNKLSAVQEAHGLPPELHSCTVGASTMKTGSGGDGDPHLVSDFKGSKLSLEVPPPLMFLMTVTPLGRDQDCSLKNREDVPAPWFLDPGGWGKAVAVGLYFIFPGIGTLSLRLKHISLRSSVLQGLRREHLRLL
ncbi:hypothetical protein STEG23_017947, partial [Scotinomys teguina]